MITTLISYIIASGALASIVVTLVMVLGTNAAQTEKLSSYECGFEPFSDAREQFDVTFYRVGLLFRIFDIEIAFRFPWSVIVLMGTKLILWLILGFSFIRVVGFVLEMKRGVLDWKWKNAALFCGVTSVNETADYNK